MFLKYFISSCIFVAGLAVSEPASAQIAELRFGLTEFDERTLDLGISVQFANENSAAINGEILFEEPEFLKWALTPQPYIGGTINLEGKTSFGGGGLLWRQSFGDKFYGDLAIGLVAHTGTNNIERQAGESFFDILSRFDEEIEFGTTILFREQVALGYNVNQSWSGEIFFEHLSNAFLDPDNDGVDNLGFRAVRKF